MSENLSLEQTLNMMKLSKQMINLEKKYAMQGSQQKHKETTCINNATSCEINSPHMNLSQTLDLVSTIKEKELKPFWNSLIKEKSKNLWLPTKTDCVGLDSSSSSSFLNSTQKLKSWFSTKISVPQKKNWSEISTILPPSLPLELMGKESIKKTKNKDNDAARTLKLRLFETPEQKQLITRWLGAFRYSWNRTLDIIDIMTQEIQDPDEKPVVILIPNGKCKAKFSSGKNKGKCCDKNTDDLYCKKHLKHKSEKRKLQRKKFIFPDVRRELLRYEIEESVENNTFSYRYHPRVEKRETLEDKGDKCNAVMKNGKTCGLKCSKYSKEYCYRHARLEKTSEEKDKPIWMKELNVPALIWKGSCKEVVKNFNASITSHGSNFTMNYKTKKDKHQFLNFEQWIKTDSPLYKEFGDIKGVCKVGKKYHKTNQLFKLLSENNEKRSFSINIDNETGKIFLLLPVSYNFLKDLESDTQAPNLMKAIAFDPGVRCFLTGYTPNHILEIGKGDNLKIYNILLKAFFLQARIARKINPKHRKKYKKKMLKLRLKVKRKITDFHWKSVGFIIDNYENIFLPPFEVSNMLRSNKLNKVSKVQLSALSFYKFKQKLKYRVLNSEHNHLYDPTEEYTTKTCTNCGSLETLKEDNGCVVHCPSCKTRVDRDFAGARNYYLKSLYGSIASGSLKVGCFKQHDSDM